jgi:cytochrome P450
MRAPPPRVVELATALLDDLAQQGPPADLHQALAMPLPIQVICELLGVPYADRDQPASRRCGSRSRPGSCRSVPVR